MTLPLVDGRGHSIEQLFGSKIYHLGFFQREYVWERKQIEKLILDLFTRFDDQWQPTHEQVAIDTYETYFLGPVVTYEANSQKYLADGQQRFLTLLVLLIYVRRLLVEQDEITAANMVDRAITNTRPGQFTFTVDVPEYRACLDAFYHDRDFPVEDEPLNVQRLWGACSLVTTLFPAKLRGEALPFFATWLLFRVSLVEISAGGARRAWEVFQTMNDRGKQLTSTDLLKGYLIHGSPAGEQDDLRGRWQRTVAQLDRGGRELSNEFIQTLIRAKYVAIDDNGTPDAAELKLAVNAPHEWFRDYEGKVWPQRHDGDFARFIRQIVGPLGALYASLSKATTAPAKGQEAIFFNARNGLIQQFDLTLAAAKTVDTKTVLAEKARVVAEFADAVLVRSTITNRAFDQTDYDRLVYRLLPSVRSTSSVGELRGVLSEALVDLGNDFSGLETLRLRADNGSFVRHLLARLTAWLEVGAEKVDPVLHYLFEGPNGPTHQIEHLWPNRYELYKDDIASEADFAILRDRLGGLVLLNAGENAGMGGAPLVQKMDWYRHQNLLAGTVNGIGGRGSAKLKSFVKRQGLTDHFAPYVGGIERYTAQRSKLYRAMAERIWGDPPAAAAPRGGTQVSRGRRRQYGIELDQLVGDGKLPVGTVLNGSRRGVKHTAVVLEGGLIQTASGATFDSPSPAAADALNGTAANGWTFWHARINGKNVLLDKLRKDYTQSSP